jgi:hypothetical protein
MTDDEAFVQGLFDRTEAALLAVRGDHAKEAEVLFAAVKELVAHIPDAKAPHIFVSDGWGKVDALFERLELEGDEYDRWCDALDDAWSP